MRLLRSVATSGYALTFFSLATTMLLVVEIHAQSGADAYYPDGLPPVIDILDGEITVGSAPVIRSRTLADRRAHDYAPAVNFAPVRSGSVKPAETSYPGISKSGISTARSSLPKPAPVVPAHKVSLAHRVSAAPARVATAAATATPVTSTPTVATLPKSIIREPGSVVSATTTPIPIIESPIATSPAAVALDSLISPVGVPVGSASSPVVELPPPDAAISGFGFTGPAIGSEDRH